MSSRTSVRLIPHCQTLNCRPFSFHAPHLSQPDEPTPRPWREPRRWARNLALDEWAEREVRPISLSQIMFFGRRLTQERLLLAGNYVRTELPTRLAHRLRDMQNLPYKVVSNQHMSRVYAMYESAFDKFRRVPELKSAEDNDKFCFMVSDTLKQHLTVIPTLVIAVIEARNLMDPDRLDDFVGTMLKSRISRRVLAEQQISLTEAFRQSVRGNSVGQPTGYVGDVLKTVNASDVIKTCSAFTREIIKQNYGQDTRVPEVVVEGDVTTEFPYPVGHLEYIIGELLRNSIQATIDRTKSPGDDPPPIQILIAQNDLRVTIRISDVGGGISVPALQHLWSFSKGPFPEKRLENLNKVPKLAATMTEMGLEGSGTTHRRTSLSSLSSRSPNLRLGIGLPMSKVYAEYWAGDLSIHNLEGYGTDAFLEISKLGNRNEHVTTRAAIDAV